jgi:WD40 repeat protein/serine/threonine protein kinase
VSAADGTLNFVVPPLAEAVEDEPVAPPPKPVPAAPVPVAKPTAPPVAQPKPAPAPSPRRFTPQSSEPPRLPEVTPPPQALQATPAPGSRPTQRQATPEISLPPASSIDVGRPTSKPATGPVTAGLMSLSLPGYEILGELGRGGMGVVYKARQIGLNRLVALKMILASGHASSEDLARFKLEAEAVARVHHPGIVQIYDIGQHNGLPYFSLEFCAGGTLATKLNGTPVPPRQAAAVIAQVAQAVQAAHDANIIHRDLKPQNILLQPRDSATQTTTEGDAHTLITGTANSKRTGRGSSKGSTTATNATNPSGETQFIDKHTILKLTDFGLAKELNVDSGQTQSGAILGTPSYMAPEQADSTLSKQVGPASDIWALGAVLYELLTGRPPFKGVSPMETIFQLLTRDPVPPTQLQAGVPRDLETIVLKCLHKDPTKRYPSAVAVAEDLERFLAGESILARPAGLLERTLKWVRRRPAIAALVALVALMIVGAGIAGTLFNLSLQKERDAAQTARRAAEAAKTVADEQREIAQNERTAADEQRAAAQRAATAAEAQRKRAELELERANSTLYANGIALSERELDRIAPQDTTGRLRARGLLDECRWDLRGWEWRLLDARMAGTTAVRSLAASSKTGRTYLATSADGKHLASVGEDGTCKVFALPSGQLVQTIKADKGRFWAVAFSPDGKWLALGPTEPQVRIVEWATNKEIRRLRGFRAPTESVAFSPDGARVAAGGRFPDDTVRVWSLADGVEQQVFAGHSEGGLAVAFSPDGTRLATASYGGNGMVWDLATGKDVLILRGHTARVTDIAFSPDGTRLASTSHDARVRVWDARNGRQLLNLSGHTAATVAVRFHPDGHSLVSASSEGGSHLNRADDSVIVWDAKFGHKLLDLRGQNGATHGLAFTADGHTLATADMTGQVKLWSASPSKGVRVFGHPGAIGSINFSPDQTLLAAGTYDGSLRLWSVRDSKPLGDCIGHTQPVLDVAFAPDGSKLYSLAVDINVFSGVLPELKIWSTSDRRLLHARTLELGAAFGLLLHPNGKEFYTCHITGVVGVWSAETGELLHKLSTPPNLLMPLPMPVLALALSPDGTRLAGHTFDSRMLIWDVNSREIVQQFSLPTQPMISLQFSGDGKYLVLPGGETGLSLQKAIGLLRSNKGAKQALEMLSEGLVKDPHLLVVNASTGAVVQSLKGYKAPIYRTRCSPDGRYAITVDGNPRFRFDGGDVKVWDLHTGRLVVTRHVLQGAVFAAAFSSDGQYLAAGGYDNQVRIWDWADLMAEVKSKQP